MASAKKPSTTANPLLKTYGERPVPFQFPGNQEKMYIGSEVIFSYLSFIFIFIFYFKGWQLFTFISWYTL